MKIIIDQFTNLQIDRKKKYELRHTEICKCGRKAAVNQKDCCIWCLRKEKHKIFPNIYFHTYDCEKRNEK